MNAIGAALPVRRIELGGPLAPFGDAPAALPVLGVPLAQSQEAAARDAGLGPMVAASDGPYLALGDHTWVTPALLRAFVDACPEQGGQLVIDGPFATYHAGLQDLLAHGEGFRVPVAVLPGGAPDPGRLAALPAVHVDLGERMHAMPSPHPAFDHAYRGDLPLTDRMVHTITHWSHLARVNQLAMLARFEGRYRAFQSAPWWRKGWEGAAVLARARSVSTARVVRALGEQGPGCKVHPTAVIEASVLGEGVHVGPHAVVRGCWLGDGVKVGEHAELNLTVAHAGASLGRGVMANLCLLLPRAFVSAGWGFQACVFGRESFVAMGACFYDLSFGGEVRVRHHGQRVDSGTHFLGVCVGDRTKVGPNVIVGYGEAIPSDAFLVADPSRIFRRLPEVLPGGPVACVNGEIVEVGRGSTPKRGTT